jgi:hypothetical protein
MINGRITKEIRNKIINTSRPSTVGKIKIGETTTRTKSDGVTTYQIPKALDYFIAKSENLTYVEMYNDLIGKTSNLTITFESDKLNECCFERIVYRDGSGKNIAYGDGEIFNVWSKLEKKYIQTNISAIDLKKQLNLDGKVEFTLIFKIMELQGFFGLWEFNSRGVQTSIKNITDVFDKMVLFAFDNDIEFTKIPFHLSVKKHTSNNLSNSSYPVVSLVPLFVPETNNNFKLANNKPLELSK